MKIQPNYAYYKSAVAFADRIRMHSHDNSRTPIRSQNNPNLYVYVYEDSNPDLRMEDRNYDTFTGLRDKQYLLKVLEKRIEESKSSGKALSIAMFDMDNFKSVNELLGYETGDMFIKAISGGIDSVAKENKLSAYRFGGEEFVIVFDGQSQEEQKQIVDKILSSVNSNKDIKSKEDDYMNVAEERLIKYSVSTSKINRLINLKNKTKIYNELLANLTTNAAKKDAYLLKSVKKTDEELNAQYASLAKERLDVEEDTEIRQLLMNVINSYEKTGKVSSEYTSKLDEYLKFSYDKSAEAFQIKKWLKDFLNNGGFSITGSDVTFDQQFMEDKTPMQLIGIAGEVLKKGKETSKGKGYYFVEH